MNTVKYKSLRLEGETGELVNNITDHWLLGLRESNPAIIDMFRDRDLKPYRDMLPWSGEFAGKYITGAYYVYRLTGRADLYAYITRFIDELLTYQDTDGYIGCFSKDCRLTGAYSQDPSRTCFTWDSWNHYHIMYGLLMWYDVTGNEKYFTAVEKAAGLFMRKFYDGKPTIVSIGSSEMNLAVYHLFGLLYRRTRNQNYLYFANKIEGDLSDPNAGDYINYALKGYEYYQCPKPRWESMHVIMGIAEMYRNTGNQKYLDAVRQIFYSILKTDVHNTGAFSTDEQAIGNPYRNSAIETCCVIAYNALAIELYELTGDRKILDFLEVSHYNAILGYNNPTGRWSTYNTPMEGTKCANYHSIVFQCRPGSPDLNCCSVNAPRGVASVYHWLLTENEDTLYLNFYENMTAELADGTLIRITGDYPVGNGLTVSVKPAGERRLALRIPEWSAHTVISCGGETYTPKAGEYYTLRNFKGGDIRLRLDFTPYTRRGGEDTAVSMQNPSMPDMKTQGGRDYMDKYSIYVGPVLYAFDNGENPAIDFFDIPAVSARALAAAVPERRADGAVLLKLNDGITLIDFYHAGVSGTSYKTWLSMKD